MTTASAKLTKVTLNLARTHKFPDGSTRHGYEFVAPLTEDGKICLDAWKANRGACFVHRFWADEEEMRGFLAHRPGGAGGATWSFDYDTESTDDDEAGYRFGDHAFNVGEYVSVRDEDGELQTFKVVKLTAL